MDRTSRNLCLAVGILVVLVSCSLFADHQVVARLPTGIGPGKMAASPDGSTLYVLNSDSADVSRFRVSDLRDLGPVKVGHVPMDVSMTATHAVVTCFSDGTLWTIDLESGKTRGPVRVGDGPRAVSIPVEGQAWVAGYYDGILRVVDLEAMRVSREINLEKGLTQIVPVPGHPHVWIMNTGRDRFHVMDRTNLSLVRDVVGKLGHGLWDTTIDPNSNRLICSGWGSNTLAILDGPAGDRLALFETGGTGAVTVVVSPDGRRSYVAHSESDTVTAIDNETGSLVGEAATGRFPFSHLALSPGGDELVVTNDNDRTVTFFRTQDLARTQDLPVGRIPHHLLYAGGRLFVACNSSNHVAVIE